MIKTAVVILNWNGENFLKKFLPGVISNSVSDFTRVFVVDNGSNDGSVDYCKTKHPEVELIILDKNYGFTGGYNKSLFQIDAEYFVLLNSDIEVQKNWIEPIIDLMDSDSSIGACMPKIKSFDNPNYFEYAGASGGFIDKFGYPFCRGRIISNIEEDKNQYNEVSEIFWATGACLFVKASAYKDLGGLDDHFFAHMEEIDLCWRMKNAGYKIYCQPKSVVHHVGGGTLPNNSPRKIFLNYRNNLLLLYKNLPKNKLYTTIFTRMVLDGLSASIYLLKGEFSFFTAVFKAHIDFYKKLKLYRKKRLLIQKNLKSNLSFKEIYPKSIVFSFYIKRKTSFKELKF